MLVPTEFAFPYHMPALSLKYATDTAVRREKAFIDEYRVFAMATQINDLFLGPGEEFVYYVEDLATHYRYVGHVLGEGHAFPVAVSSNQRFLIEQYIYQYTVDPLTPPPMCFLFTLQNTRLATRLVETYPSPYPLQNENGKIYVDLRNVDEFAKTYEELSVSLWFSAGHKMRQGKLDLVTSDLPQPLLISSAPLVL